MTRQLTIDTLNRLNPKQRAALRRRFGSSKIRCFTQRDELFAGVFEFCVTFDLGDCLIQYQGGVGPRGGLRDVQCFGRVPA